MRRAILFPYLKQDRNQSFFRTRYELTLAFSHSLHSIIVETDSTTIASRVSRAKADTTEIVINEQTIMNAYQTMKEKMTQRIAVGF